MLLPVFSLYLGLSRLTAFWIGLIILRCLSDRVLFENSFIDMFNRAMYR